MEIFGIGHTTESEPPLKRVLLSSVTFPNSSVSAVVTGVKYLWGDDNRDVVIAGLTTSSGPEIIFLRINIDDDTYVTIFNGLTACNLPQTQQTTALPGRDQGYILATDCATTPTNFYAIGFSSFRDAAMTSQVLQISMDTDHELVKLVGIASLSYDES